MCNAGPHSLVHFIWLTRENTFYSFVANCKASLTCLCHRVYPMLMLDSINLYDSTENAMLEVNMRRRVSFISSKSDVTEISTKATSRHSVSHTFTRLICLCNSTADTRFPQTIPFVSGLAPRVSSFQFPISM